MPSAVNLGLLNRLDREIAKKKLHQGDTLDPIYVFPLIQDLDWWYGLQADKARAVTQRWKQGRERFTDIGFDLALKEPELSAEHRRAIVHEWAHVFCKHRGDFFILWEDGEGPEGFDRFVDDIQERQCDYVSAYILIKRSALIELKDRPGEEIARILDVPEHLVELRWYIWRKHGR